MSKVCIVCGLSRLLEHYIEDKRYKDNHRDVCLYCVHRIAKEGADYREQIRRAYKG